MCKRCSHHVDLRDYHITSAVSKNFRTKGLFVVEEKGNVFNTEVLVGDAIIKGKFLGKLVAERSLTVHSGAQIKGSFKTGRLIVPAGNGFRGERDTPHHWQRRIAANWCQCKNRRNCLVESTRAVFWRCGNGKSCYRGGAAMVGAAKIGISFLRLPRQVAVPIWRASQDRQHFRMSVLFSGRARPGRSKLRLLQRAGFLRRLVLDAAARGRRAPSKQIR